MVGNSYSTVLRDVLGIEAEFAPQVEHLLDEFYDLPRDAWPAWPSARDPSPVSPESLVVPAEDRLWLDDEQR